jgi:hypothetical protein
MSDPDENSPESEEDLSPEERRARTIAALAPFAADRSWIEPSLTRPLEVAEAYLTGRILRGIPLPYRPLVRAFPPDCLVLRAQDADAKTTAPLPNSVALVGLDYGEDLLEIYQGPDAPHVHARPSDVVRIGCRPGLGPEDIDRFSHLVCGERYPVALAEIVDVRDVRS